MDDRDLATDRDSFPGIKPGNVVVLKRDWATYTRGEQFRVISLIPCTGGSVYRQNARVVFKDDPAAADADSFLHRTIPAELLVRVPHVHESFEENFNQGMRPCRWLAFIGDAGLFDYEMPGGRIFLRIADPFWGRSRSVSEANLPAKWRRAIDGL